MESPTWPEVLPNNRIKMIQELTRGEEWTNKLWEVLRSGKIEPDSISIDDVVVQVERMFENTLSIMGSCSLINEPHQTIPTSDLHSSCNSDWRKSEIASDESSTRSIIPVKMKRGCYTRRKSSWTATKVTSELVDDGHAWRKYGQKEIHNKKYQRSYYRCTYKYDQGCQATKQVQMIQDKPPNYSITYFGHHTCKNFHRAPPVIILDSQDPTDHTSICLNFETKGIVERKQVEPYFPTLKYEHHEESTNSNSSSAYQSWDLSTQIPSELGSMLSSKFDHTDMTSSGVCSGLDQGDMTILAASSQVYEMNRMFWNE